MNDKIVDGSITQIKKIYGNIEKAQTIYKDNYNDLKNKPSINGVLLKGNITINDLGIDSENILNLAQVAQTGSYEDLLDKPSIDINKDYVDDALTKKVDKITGKGLSTNDFTTEEKIKLTGLENYDDTAVRSDIAMNKSSIGLQKKNLLKNTAVSKTLNGITFTVNDDKSVSCTEIADALTRLYVGTIYLKNNRTYIFSGGINSNRTIQLISKENGTTIYYVGNKEFKYTTENDIGIDVYITIGNGEDMSIGGNVFYPMARYADITDDTYEPYVDDLQTQINALIARIEALEG